jgi:hypothetical protein
MNKEQFKYIWKTKICANGPWRFCANKSEAEKLYFQKLKKFEREILEEAVSRLLDSSSDSGNGLPTVGKFIEYCIWVTKDNVLPKQPTTPCPCCCGDGWIYVSDIDKSVQCDCNKTKQFKKISEAFHPNKKCEIFECNVGGFTFIDSRKIELGACPKGAKHYEKYQTLYNQKQELPF